MFPGRFPVQFPGFLLRGVILLGSAGLRRCPQDGGKPIVAAIELKRLDAH